MKVVLPNLLCEQWRARTWCSSPKCPEPDLPLRICRKRTSYHLWLIDNFAHHLPTTTLLENIHFFICKYIYCIFKYICATTPSTYHWSKNTSSNWNIVCRSWLGFVKNNSVDIPMCICIWVIYWSDKANKPLSLMTVPLRLHHIFSCWWSFYINPSNCKWRKRNHYWCNKCFASNIQSIQMVKSKEDTSAIMTLTLSHHENVNQCINTTGYWIRFHRCLVICLQGTNSSVSGTVACMYVSLDGFRLNPDMWSYPEMQSL